MDTNYNILVPYINARYSVLWLSTFEEGRAQLYIKEAKDLCDNPDIDLNFSIIQWSITTGLVVLDGDKETDDYLSKESKREETKNPIAALKEISNFNRNTIFIFLDLSPHINANPVVRRIIRDISANFKNATTNVPGRKNEVRKLYRTLIIVDTESTIHPNLNCDITNIDYKLPGEETLGKMINGFFHTEERLALAGGKQNIQPMIEACKGFTSIEASDAIAKSIIIKGMHPDSPEIHEMIMVEKANTLKKTGILEFYPTQIDAKDIGGLDVLKNWLAIRQKAFSVEAREFGLPSPRGILLAGIPGCGKSLAAKAIASLYKIPLVRFDIGRIFGNLVGQSEQNMRTAIKAAEAIGQCVLWIDEIDKAFAGMSSNSNGDSGVSQRVFGNFITWMQEKTVPVFVVATANRIGNLPPELMRKGRFDQMFFVDLPNVNERREIFEIHVNKRRTNVDIDYDLLANRSEGFSGAEIEESVISALYQAFYQTTEISTELILNEVRSTQPLSKTRSAEIQELITWSKDNALSASVSITGSDKVSTGNRL